MSVPLFVVRVTGAHGQVGYRGTKVIPLFKDILMEIGLALATVGPLIVCLYTEHGVSGEARGKLWHD